MTLTDTRTEPHIDTREALLDAAEKLFSEHGIQAVAYEDTETYRITKQFTADPGTFLEMLLGAKSNSERQ